MNVAISKLSGYSPALPTPFDGDGSVSYSAFEQFCDLQIHHGAQALIVCGTTGEAPTLTAAERFELVRVAVNISGGRVPVIAGAGSNSTDRACDLARQAECAGADALLCVVPYYNKPMQAGLYQHYCAIAQATGLPIILYDVPSRTACGLADTTIARLAQLRNIIGLKDAAGDITRPTRLRALLGPHFRLLSGNDASALSYVFQGGDGCISVASNIAPGLCRDMYRAHENGEIVRAQRLGAVLLRLTAVLFKETNPAPVKYALSLLGLMLPRVRLPLVEPTDQSKAELMAVMIDLSETHGPDIIANCRAITGPALAYG